MLAKRWRLAFLGVALVLWTSIVAVTPVCADDVQAVVHYAAPAGYHAMWGKYGENGTLYMPYHFIIDYTHHKLYDLPCDLVIGPYEGLPDTYDLGIRYEREAAVSLRIYPGDNITLIGHFTDAQGNDLEQPYLEVVYGVPISPGGWPTPTTTTVASTTPGGTTVPTPTTTAPPSLDQQLAACLAGGPCASCPTDVCAARGEAGARLYAMGPYIGFGGECSLSLAFTSTDGRAMVLISGTSQLSWSGHYRYLKIAQVSSPPVSVSQIVVGYAYELGPEDLTSSTPLELKLSYDPARLPSGVREEDLYMGWWNSSALVWKRVDATLEAAENCVVGNIDHFSIYAVVSPRPPATFTTTPTTSTTASAPSSQVFPATPPTMVVITVSSQATEPLPIGSGGVPGLRAAVYALTPPVAVLLMAIAACAVIMRWMR